jgi:hypothetical protein
MCIVTMWNRPSTIGNRSYRRLYQTKSENFLRCWRHSIKPTPSRPRSFDIGKKWRYREMLLCLLVISAEITWYVLLRYGTVFWSTKSLIVSCTVYSVLPTSCGIALQAMCMTVCVNTSWWVALLFTVYLSCCCVFSIFRCNNQLVYPCAYVYILRIGSSWAKRPKIPLVEKVLDSFTTGECVSNFGTRYVRENLCRQYIGYVLWEWSMTKTQALVVRYCKLWSWLVFRCTH